VKTGLLGHITAVRALYTGSDVYCVYSTREQVYRGPVPQCRKGKKASRPDTRPPRLEEQGGFAALASRGCRL